MFGFSWRFMTAGVALSLAAGGIVYLVKTIREDGARAEREAVTIQNRESGNVGENRRLDYRECFARGLRFDFDAGECES